MRSHMSYQAAQVANATVCNMQQHRCGNYGNMQMLQVHANVAGGTTADPNMLRVCWGIDD